MNKVSTISRVGKDVKGATTVEEILNNAGLNYMVGTRPIYFDAHGTTFEVPKKKVTFKLEDPDQVFGVVGEKYQVCQNIDAFEFLNYMEDITVIKAGETVEGMAYIIGELPSITTLGDEIRPNVIFQNSHDGWSSIKSTICMLRVVCQNQFSYAFASSNNTIKVRHSINMKGNLKEAQKQLEHSYEYIQTYVANMEKLAATPITREDIDNILKNVIIKPFERKDADKKTLIDQMKVDRFMSAYNADDNQNFKGTALGVVNAFTDYSTHTPETNRNRKNFADRQFITNTLYNPDLKAVMNYVNDLAA